MKQELNLITFTYMAWSLPVSLRSVAEGDETTRES